MAEVQYYELDQVFPCPLTVAQVDALKALTRSAGWNVLTEVVGIDAHAAMCGAIDTAATTSERDQNVAALKSLGWILTLRDRLDAAMEDAVAVDDVERIGMTIEESNDLGVPTVIDCLMHRIRK